MESVDCVFYRERVSAGLDGELTALEAEALRSHLGSCAPCRTWDAQARLLSARMEGSRRAARSTLWPGKNPPADLTADILAAIAWPAPAATKLGRISPRSGWCDSPAAVARLALVLAASVQIAFSFLALADASSSLAPPLSPSPHWWGPVLAVGLLGSALRPQWTVALLPVIGVAAVVLLTTAAISLVHGRSTMSAEIPYVAVVVGVVAMWSLWGNGRAPAAVGPSTRD